MDTKGNKVALYCRVSSQEQATEGVSIEAQLSVIHAYAQSQGWEVIGEYVDAGHSGATDQRPELKRLLTDARKHSFDIIAVAKLDRYFRNLRLLLNHLHELEQLGIKFVATQEMLDTSTPYGKFAIQIMGVIAEFERGRIGERVRDSRHYLLTQGRWAGGRPLYGYRWLPKQRCWEVVPEEAEIVRYIHHLYLHEKLGIMLIPLRLNKENIRTRDGALWRYRNVHQILTHPGYKGQHPIGLTMPVIIDEDTWKQAQQKREQARKIRSAVKGWLLQGMCVCGKCGHVLKCIQKRGKVRYYVCRGRLSQGNLDGSPRCTAPWVKAHEFEWAVWNKVKSVVQDPATLVECVKKALAELEEKRKRIGIEVKDIDHDLERIKTKEERLGIAFVDGAIKEETYKTKLQQLKKQKTMLLNCRQNLDPDSLSELAGIDERINGMKEILSKGRFTLTEFGIFGMAGDKYAPVGFNAWRETDGRLDIGQTMEQDRFPVEGTNLFMKGINAPPGFWVCNDPYERDETIKRNMRGMLQLFNIRVHIFSDRVEIHGAIPSQVLRFPTQKQPVGAPIITSAPTGKGESSKERGRRPLSKNSPPLIVGAGEKEGEMGCLFANFYKWWSLS